MSDGGIYGGEARARGSGELHSLISDRLSQGRASGNYRESGSTTPPQVPSHILTDQNVQAPLLANENVQAPLLANEERTQVQVKERLQSLDAFRGLNIAWMIFVDEAGGTYKNVMDHSPWNGIRLADFVFPFFCFIMGVSIPLALRSKILAARQQNDKALYWAVSKKIMVRTLKLFLLGLLVQGGDFPSPGATGFYSLERLRIPGILQRLSCCYFVVSFFELFMPWSAPAPAAHNIVQRSAVNTHLGMFRRYKFLWASAALIALLYFTLLLAIRMPDDICHGTPWNHEYCNAANRLDRALLGVRHLYDEPTLRRSRACSSCYPALCPRPDAPFWCMEPFDPEGPTSTLGAIVSTMFGAAAGRALKDLKDPRARLVQLFGIGGTSLFVGFLLYVTTAMPFNKNLWTLSYTLFTAGVAMCMLATFYVILDIYKIFLAPLVWMGSNAIFVFLLGPSCGLAAAVVAWVQWGSDPNDNVPAWFQHQMVKAFGPDAGILLQTFVKLCIWFAISGILYHKKIFYKV